MEMDKRKMSIILAVVCALIGLFLLKNWISATEKQFVKQEKMGFVLVAAATIPAGSVIDANMVRPEKIPEAYIQRKAINSQAMVVGKRAITEITPGDQILSTNLSLAAREAGATMAMRTPPGKRATTLTVPILSAVGGQIRMNDYVDVVGSFPYNVQVDGKTVSELVTVTLFQNVLVLSVSGNAPSQEDRGKAAGPAPTTLVVTLALTPQEAAILSYVQDQTKLRLLLRTPLDTKSEPVRPVDLNGMWQYVFSSLGQEFMTPKEEPKKVEKKPAPPPPPAPTVEVYRGTEKANMVLK